MKIQEQLNIDELRQIILDSSKISTKNPIVRDDYSRWLKKGTENNFIKVITGFRRVGKSFLLKQLRLFLIEEKKVPVENILFINFEHDLLANYKKVSDLRHLFDLFKTEIMQPGPVYLFLDEVQNVKQWEKFVRTIYDSEKEKYNIFVTGSNSSLLSSEFSTALSGRVIEKEIHSFSFLNYLKFKNIEINNDFDRVEKQDLLQKNVLEYLKNGGLPETINQDEEIIRTYIKSLFRKVLIDDILNRFKIEKFDILEKLFYFIISNVGQVTSFSKIMGTLASQGEKITIATLQEYTKMYDQTFAWNKISKFDWKNKKIFSKNYKFYSFDNGLLNNLHISKLDIKEKLLENLVFNVLRKKYNNIYYGRDDRNKEIDFIIPQNNKSFLKIQVTVELHEENKKRELGNFVLADKYLKAGQNIIITLNGKRQVHQYKNTEIQEIPLLNLLLKKENLDI